MTNALLITADRELRRFVREALDELPVKLLRDCETHRDAIEVFREERPKLVLVDLFISESSGIDIVKTMKKLDDKMTIILLSRLRTRTVKDRAFRTGADDVLVYPMSPEILRDATLHRLETMKLAEAHAQMGK